jgi:hypothetical protein
VSNERNIYGALSDSHAEEYTTVKKPWDMMTNSNKIDESFLSEGVEQKDMWR